MSSDTSWKPGFLDEIELDCMTSDTNWKPGFLDTIELDCMRYESATKRYSFFEKLPDEVMLLIMKSLDISDLLKTVRVCQRIQPVAQQALYGSIKENTEKRKTYLFTLFRTLQDRPQLARLVSSIALYACDTYGEIEQYPNIELYPNRSLDCGKVNARVTHARFIGLLLWLLPQLTELTLDIEPKLGREDIEPLVLVLGPEYNSRKPGLIAKLHRVPAFQNLSKLRFACGQQFPWSLSLLPKLHSIHLDKICFFSKNQNRNEVLGKSKVKELSLECDIAVLRPRSPGRYNSFESFLGMFSSLKSIHLHIRSLEWAPRTEKPGNCSTLINRLKVLSGTLDKLKLSIPPGNPLTHLHMNPVNSLVLFSNIREISMPYYWLEDERLQKENSPFDVDFSTLFPQSLEVLELQVPNIRVGGWLAEFANQRMKRGDFLRLRQINLVCMEYYGGYTYEVLRYYPSHRALLDLMRNQGVSVKLSSTNALPEWDDENYDPVANLILTQLRASSRTYTGGMVWDGFTEKAARMSGYQSIKISHIELPSRRILYRFQ